MNVEEAFTAYVMAMGNTPNRILIAQDIGGYARWLPNELEILKVLGEAQQPTINAIQMYNQLLDYENHHGNT